MPYITTPAGHYTYLSCECYNCLRRYDEEYCEDCEHSPCRCEDNEYEDYENFDSRYDNSELLRWNFQPPRGFTFYGDGPAFYGMEIEVSSNNDGRTLGYARRTLETEHGTLAYLKADGSVNGFEMVTEPMSYEWAMANFPWDVLPGLAERACYAERGENGIHVHVSRNAFSCPSHLFRWMKLFYRNQEHIERIARRCSTNWAMFRPHDRKAQIQHVKNKGDCRDGTQHTRYSAINTTNPDTIEVRVFASSLDVAEAQSALQLVASTVEYTRMLSKHHCTPHEDARISWEWNTFRDWLQLSSDKYPALAEIETAARLREIVGV